MITLYNVEGSVCSGKSTYMTYLKRTCGNIVTLPEPDILTLQNSKSLKKFYANQNFGLDFELELLRIRADQLINCIDTVLHTGETDVDIYVERLFWPKDDINHTTKNAFVLMQEGDLVNVFSEAELSLKHKIQDMYPDVTIKLGQTHLVTVDLDTVKERVITRNRNPGEVEDIMQDKSIIVATRNIINNIFMGSSLIIDGTDETYIRI